MPDRYFIPEVDQRDFETAGRRIPRSLLRDDADLSTRPTLLDAHVRSLIAAKVRLQDPWFEALAISVHPDDGMTWSAEEVARTIASGPWNFTPWCLPDRQRDKDLPAIASYIGERKFLSLAVKHKLVDPFLTWRSWSSIGVVTGAFLVGWLAAIAATLSDNLPIEEGASFAQILTTPQVYYVAAATATLGLVALLVQALVSARTFSGSRNAFIERHSTIESSDDVDGLVGDLARALRQNGLPRVVIVDNYASLDRTTKSVFDRYCREFVDRHTGAELWVVFEKKQSGGNFGVAAAMPGEGEEGKWNGYQRTTLWDQPKLNEEERTKLLKVLGREGTGLFTVKAICEGIDEGAAGLERRASEHRLAHPAARGYTTLDLLYLLSFTTAKLSLEVRSLASEWAAEDRIRSRVLRLLLRHRVDLKQVRDTLSAVPSEFESLAGTRGRQPAIEVSPDVHKVLAPVAAKLELPEPALTHTFWALYWHDRLGAVLTEAFWAEKLATHARAAGTGGINDAPLRAQAEGRLFEAAMSASSGCLRMGLFTQVAPLVQSAADHMAGEPRHEAPNRRRRLLRHAWEAYAVLGEDELLLMALELVRQRPEAAPVPAFQPMLDDSMEMFADSLNLSSDARAAIALDLVAPRTQAAGDPHAIVDYAYVRSSWLALSARLSPFPFAGVTIDRVATSREVVTRIRSAFERLSPHSGDTVSIVDFMTVSLGLWCLALQCDPELHIRESSATSGSEAGDESRPPSTSEVLEFAERVRTRLEAVIDLAENAALVAQSIQKKGPSLRLDTDLVRDGLAREISGIALAASMIASQSSHKSLIADPALFVARVQGIADVVSDTLGYEIPAIASMALLDERALFERVDRLLRLCGLIWRKAELTQLGAFLQIRRLGLHSAREPDGEDTRELSTLLQSVMALGRRSDYVGVLANLEVAKHFAKRSLELSVHFKHEAALTAKAGDFGDRLRNELALIALLAGSYQSDPSPLMELLTKPGNTYLEVAFAQVPEVQIPGLVLTLCNLSDRLGRPELSARLHDATQTLASRVRSSSSREQTEALLDLWASRDEIGQSNEPAVILERWAPRATLWSYPWLLNLLLKKHANVPAVREEAERVLRRNPALDTYNTYLYLAIAVLMREGDSARARQSPAVQYLAGAIEQWSRQLPVESNIHVYMLLKSFAATERDVYHQRLVRWQMIKIEQEHVQRLPSLARKQEFFLIFREYFQLMQPWGLESELNPADLHTRLSVHEKSRRERARNWVDQQFRGVAAFVVVEGRHRVSADFLCLGEYLLSPPLDRDEEFHESRDRLNAIARKGLPTLLDRILGLEAIPPFIKQVFEQHSRRLELPGVVRSA
jgi:hypothetical protein